MWWLQDAVGNEQDSSENFMTLDHDFCNVLGASLTIFSTIMQRTLKGRDQQWSSTWQKWSAQMRPLTTFLSLMIEFLSRETARWAHKKSRTIWNSNNWKDVGKQGIFFFTVNHSALLYWQEAETVCYLGCPKWLYFQRTWDTSLNC